MTTEATRTGKQWPDNIISGEIRYGRAWNYDGFYLADASHSLPTFGSVCAENPPTIRGAHVRVFNYPGQTEQIAAELVRRWNAFPAMLDAARNALAAGLPDVVAESVRAALAKATGTSP